MSEAYEEILEGETLLRLPPGRRHEDICARLHAKVAASVRRAATSRLLDPRSVVEPCTGTLLRPDLALATVSTGKLWLAAEIIDSDDHRPDTVIKKEIYENLNVPRLWMIDPRYDNIEVYHGSPYGLALKHIFAGREKLTETLLPDFELIIAELFA